MTPERMSLPLPEIVTTTVADSDALRTFHAQSWIDTYPNEAAGVSEKWVKDTVAQWLTPERLEASRKYMSILLESPHSFHRIAKAGGQVVGMVHMSNLPGRQYLEALYVDKNYQGTGLAQSLMGQAVQWLDSSQDMSLEVAQYNGRAVKFYQNYGFEIKPGSEHFYADTIPIITMIRKGDTQ